MAELTDPASPALLVSVNLLASGDTFGAYRIVRLLGSGGMGNVYLGHDARLDRPVAIKVVKAPLGGPGELERQRLVREALALAKLSHPNILTIYEIGSVDAELFVATEYVEGGTLRQWLRAEKRPLRAILDLFLQAGRGLAAAHRLGLVHRDFKPENVLIDGQGRARVCDFGLVSGAVGVARHGDDHLTQGSLGTPAYMPPEQYGGEADARSDQYAFCTALYEALYGRRPFSGDSPEDLRRNKERARFPEPPSGTHIPAHLRAAVLRGLAGDPDRRHPSMEALLSILEKAPAAPRTRWATVVAAALVAGVGVLLVTRASKPEVCKITPEEVRLWDAPTRDRAHAAFLATGLPFADDAWKGVDTAFADWERDYAAARRDACAATRVGGHQSEELLDRRMACLDEKLHTGRALAALFARADANMVTRAVGAVEAIRSFGSCSNRAALLRPIPPPPPEKEAAAYAIRFRLAEGLAAWFAGRPKDHQQIVTEALASARALGYRPLVAHALYQLDYGTNPDSPEREALLHDALAEAVAARDDLLAARALAKLVGMVGSAPRRIEEATRYARIARALVDRTGGDVELLADIDNALAIALVAANRRPEALALFLRNLETRLQVKDGPFTLGAAHGNVGMARASLGQFDLAEAEQRVALELLIRGVGELHPYTALSRQALAQALLDRGAHVDAEREARHALAIQEQLEQPAPLIAPTLIALGAALDNLGRREEALPILERALAIGTEIGDPETTANALLAEARLAANRGRLDEAAALYERSRADGEKLGGPDHPAVANALAGRAEVDLRLGDAPRAAGALRRAMAIYDQALPADHDAFAYVRSLLGDAGRATGDLDAARSEYERAIAIWEQGRGFGYVGLAAPLTGLGWLALARGAPAEAEPLFARALGLHRANRGVLPRALGDTLFGLAQAVAANDGAKADALARDAQRAFATGGDRRRGDAVRAWLARPR